MKKSVIYEVRDLNLENGAYFLSHVTVENMTFVVA